ncbi:MAG: acetyl-CoA carboxylase biotin carboxyl carrier protein [Mariprofundales bacterium]
MDISQIRKLARLLQTSDLSEIEVKEGESSVRISRKVESSVVTTSVSQPLAAQTPLAATAPVFNSHAADEEAASDASGQNTVTSPMVGTYYQSPAPDATAFIKVGDHVNKGDTLCIIEAMKLMNEIEAEYSGIVEKILVENASPVEYGQPLLIVTPS